MSAAVTLLDPKLRDLAQMFIEVWRDVGVEVTVTSTKRSRADQERLYNAWKGGRSPYPAALPGTSTHEWGLAFDLAVKPDYALPIMGDMWKAIGGTWGGDYHGAKDPIHFEAGPDIKRAVGYVKGAPYEAPLVHEDPIGTAIETAVTPWWSGLLPFDPVAAIERLVP